MALTSYPFENQQTTEVQYGLLFRQFADTGIVGSIDGPGFTVSTNGSGLDVQVAQGFAIVRGHAVDNNAPVTLTIDPADASQPRIDTVVLRLDPAIDSINLLVLKGPPSANPVAPTIQRTDTGVFDLELARITVPAGALNIVTANVQDVRRFSGSQVGVWTSSTRPYTPINKGKLGLNTTIGMFEYWDGSAWKTVGTDKKRIVIPHTFTLAGFIQPPSGSDYFIPPFYVPAPSGQTVRLVGARSRVWHGSGAEVMWEMTRHTSSEQFSVLGSGSGVFGANRSHSLTANFTDGDRITLSIAGVTGSPKNMTLTLFMEYEV